MGRTAQEIRSRKQAKRKSNRKKQSTLPAFDGVQSQQELQEQLLAQWLSEGNNKGIVYITNIRKVKWLKQSLNNLTESGQFQGCDLELFNDSGICGVNITRQTTGS